MNHLNFSKLKARAAAATQTAVKTAATTAKTAVASRAGDVDPGMKAAHERLTELHSTYSEVHSSLRHQLLNARKTAKIMREGSSPMQDLAGVLGQEQRRGVQTVMAVDSAVARCWETYAAHVESDLLTPAKQECGSLFAEGDVIWSTYIATVNEVAARHYLATGNAGDLHGRKSAMEHGKLPRLTELAQAAEAAMVYLVDHHRKLHTALHRDALTAATSAAGEAPAGEETSALLASTRAGWQQLAQASGSASYASSHASGSLEKVFPPPPRGVFEVALESLALRPDAVHGVPLVAKVLMLRLLTASTSAGVSFLDSEGLFRVQGDTDDVDSLRRQIDSGNGPMLLAVNQAADPHVLATVLKQWLRRLPAPLIPPTTHRALVALGQQVTEPVAANAPLPAALAAALPTLIRSLPMSNLRTLHGLVELLEAVVARELVNRMSPMNLALVLTPTVCRTEESAGEQLTVEIPAVANILAAIISHRAECFPPLPSVTLPANAAEPGGGGGAFGTAAGLAEASAGVASALAAPSSTAAPAMRRKSSASEPANWWYSAGGTQCGPVTGGRLAALLANGELSLSSWVFEGGTSDWQELSQVQFRLPAVAIM